MTLLEKGRGEDAVSAAQRASELDQLGVFGALPGALQAVVAAFEDGGAGEDAIAALKQAVGPGPLAERVESLTPPS